MKKFIVLLFMFTPLQIVCGQDRIITIQQDTISCRIVSFSSAYIQYEQNVDGNIVGKFIPNEQVLEYLRSSQQVETLLSGQKFKTLKSGRRWVIGVYPGRGSMLASTTNDEKEMINMGIPKSQAQDYCKQNRHGWSISGDIHYFFTGFFGLGAKYSLFASMAQGDFTIKFDDYFPQYLCMEFKEKQYIHYAGPSVMFRQWLDKNRRLQLTETVSAGFVHYRDELRMGYVEGLINGLTESNTWGTNAGLSLGYYPVSWLSVGVNAGFMYAFLTKVDISTKEFKETVKLEKNDYEYLTRLDYSFSIRFHF